MSSAWVEDKLPIPNKNSFFEGLIDSQKDTMAHASFYYPNSNNQNTFIDALALGLDIKYNTDISSISYINDTKKWIINNEFVFDHIINTTPIDLLPFVMDNVPEMVLNAAKKLKYNSISNVLWKTKWTDKTWTYYPKDKIFHRYIHIGGFHLPKQGYTITEVVGKFSYDDMKKDGASDDFLVEPLDYNVSEHAYVVFDENYESATTIVKSYLAESGIDSIGRFGEWQYYNMDVCIKRSIDLAKKFL
jgi:protoporphyrinogen oxidase